MNAHAVWSLVRTASRLWWSGGFWSKSRRGTSASSSKSTWTRKMPGPVFDVRYASGSLTNRADGLVNARRRRRASSVDAAPCGTRFRPAGAVPDVSTSGVGPAVCGAPVGRCM